MTTKLVFKERVKRATDQQFWDLLAGLRGPDGSVVNTFSYEAKQFTIAVRRATFKHFEQSWSNRIAMAKKYTAYEPEILLEAFYQQPSHFQSHTRQALKTANKIHTLDAYGKELLELITV